MKYGIFIHPFVEDPSTGNPAYGRVRENGPIEASQEGANLEAHLNNRKIITELSKQYRVRWNSDFWYEADRIKRSDPLDNFDFMITHIPRNPLARTLELHDYGLSLGCFTELQKNKPEMVIITYTGAPRSVRKWCREQGIHVIHRDRFGLKIELYNIKDILQQHL
jgi:hypothetical protein